MRIDRLLLIGILAFAIRAEAEAQSSEPPAPAAGEYTVIRAYVTGSVDSVLARVTRILSTRANVDRIGDYDVETERFHVSDAGMLQIRAAVRTDSAGTFVDLSGSRRSLKRLLIFSAMGQPERIRYVSSNPQMLRAWFELQAIESALEPRRGIYLTIP